VLEIEAPLLRQLVDGISAIGEYVLLFFRITLFNTELTSLRGQGAILQAL